MVVHRDYMHSGDSSIKIYNDKIEFYNPGKLSGEISIEKLLSGSYSSHTRNRKIASAFKEAQLIEKYGSGIKRILNAFVNYGLKPPVFENFQSGFKVTVSSEEVSGTVSGTTAEKVLKLIKENALITIPELAKLIAVTERTIERNINRLQKENKLERIGPSFGGFWKIINQENS